MINLFMVNAFNFYSLLKAIKSFNQQGKSLHSYFDRKGQSSVLKTSLRAHSSFMTDPELFWPKEYSEFIKRLLYAKYCTNSFT